MKPGSTLWLRSSGLRQRRVLCLEGFGLVTAGGLSVMVGFMGIAGESGKAGSAARLCRRRVYFLRCAIALS